jgi:hypothetical protein
MKTNKIKAYTVLRFFDLDDPSSGPTSVATFSGKNYESAKKCFLREIRKIAKRLHINLYEQELQQAEEDGYMSLGCHHIYLLGSYP